MNAMKFLECTRFAFHCVRHGLLKPRVSQVSFTATSTVSHTLAGIFLNVRLLIHMTTVLLLIYTFNG
jgi:hypothetical protein